MIVDSSVWIDYFAGAETRETEFLHSVLGVKTVAIGDLILTEVLQGFRNDRDYQLAYKQFHSMTVYNMLGRRTAAQSAMNFRQLRKKGITIRKTADVIIATFCIEHHQPLLFSDKDFKPFVQHMGLKQA